MEKKYDYLVVGAGLFGSVFARQATNSGKRVLVIEREKNAGGALRCSQKEGITVHAHGAHIFHTDSETVWNYVNRYTSFIPYRHIVVARCGDFLYELPFNINTFYQVYGVINPKEVREMIDTFGAENVDDSTVEGFSIRRLGTKMYETLIKGYTEKQWGRSCKELPASLIGRLPIRMSFDNGYFADKYQGIPKSKDGYNELIHNLLNGIEVKYGYDCFHGYSDPLIKKAKKVICTGSIDEYFNYCFGAMAYRSLCHSHHIYDIGDYQGTAVVNYTSKGIAHTRVIEHKHFRPDINVSGTIVTFEYPIEWEPGLPRYYPINNHGNMKLYSLYEALAKKEAPNTIFGGRLGTYRYLDMDDTVAAALQLADRELKGGD